MQVGRAKQADQAVAQVFPLQQHKDGDDQDDDGGGERVDDRGDDPFGELHRRGIGLVDLHLHRFGFSGWRWFRTWGGDWRGGWRIQAAPYQAHFADGEALD